MNTKKDQYTGRKTKKVNIKERKPRKAKFQGQLQWPIHNGENERST